MPHNPTIRKVPARFYTTAGWLRASIPLLVSRTLLQHVEHGGEGRFLSVVDAELPGSADRVAFLALQRGAITVIVPDAPEDLEPEPAAAVDEHPVRFLLEHGFMTGNVRLIRGTRLSTFLSHHDGFFTVHDAVLHRNLSAEPVHLSVALVNACRLIGVVDAA